MRKSNEKRLDSGIYARLRQVQMSAADRQHAADSLHQAEAMVDAILWVREKIASVGHVFLKPSLKH